MRSISPIDISNKSFLASVGEDDTLVVSDFPRVLKLDLLEYGCNWVGDYLRTNAQVEEGDRQRESIDLI